MKFLTFIFQVLSSLITSTQGLAVSALLCFTNNDVFKQLSNFFRKKQRDHSLHSVSRFKVSDVSRDTIKAGVSSDTMETKVSNKIQGVPRPKTIIY